MVLCEVDNNGYQHGEGLLLVSLEDIEEVVVLKEAHRAVSHLKMDTADALDDALEQPGYQVLDSVYLTNLQHLLQLSEEERLLHAVGKGPILKQSVEKRDGECAVFGEEEHRAS